MLACVCYNGTRSSEGHSPSKEEKTMKTYHIKPEYYDLWGAWDGNDTVTTDEIEQLAREWEMTVDELMEQVEEDDDE